jgi:hypothetical protein
VAGARVIAGGASLLVLLALAPTLGAGEPQAGNVDWVGGVVSAVGQGTAKPSGNRPGDRIKAERAAEVMAQRALAETIHGVRVEGTVTVKDRVQESTVRSRLVRGARKVRSDLAWEGDVPVATVELRVCLSADAPGCGGGSTLVQALAPGEQGEPPGQAPAVSPEGEEGAFPPQKGGSVAVGRASGDGLRFDSARPVTGMVLELRGARFDRVLFPVVVTPGVGGKAVTVYSAKIVRPEVVRTIGVARYADTLEQALGSQRLGDNPAVVPVSEVTKDNRIVLRPDHAKALLEATRFGNDFLAEGKVMVAGAPGR